MAEGALTSLAICDILNNKRMSYKSNMIAYQAIEDWAVQSIRSKLNYEGVNNYESIK